MPNAPRFLPRDLVLAAALGLLVVAVHGHFVPDHVYGYDEADYRTAAEATLADHWLDRPSITLREFAASGRNSLSGTGDPVSRSERVRGSGDLAFLRHYHGPVYWYGLAPAARLAGASEAALRRSGLVGAVLLAWVVYAGCLGLGLGRPAALFGASFVVFSPELIETFGVLNPHGPYAVLSTGALFLAAHALRTGSRRAWWAVAAAVGAAFATLAFSALLALAVLLCAALAARARGLEPAAARRAGLYRCLLTLGVLALLWPAAFLKLTLLRGYAFYGYLALARPTTYGHVGALAAWRARLAFSPLEWAILFALLAGGALLLWRDRREGRGSGPLDSWAAPFLLYGTLMGATTLFITTPQARYTASLLPVLFVLAGAALGRLLSAAKPGPRAAAGLALAGALALNLFLADRAAPLAPNPSKRLDDRVVENLRLVSAGERLLLPRYYVPIVGWYLPRATLLGRDGAADLLEAAAGWRPDSVLYRGARDAELEAGLLAARDAESGGSVTVSEGSRRITILRFARGPS